MQRSKSVGAKTEVNENVLRICMLKNMRHERLFNEIYEETGLLRSSYKTNAEYIAAVIEKQLTDIRNEMEILLPGKHETSCQYKYRIEKNRKDDSNYPLNDVLSFIESATIYRLIC